MGILHLQRAQAGLDQLAYERKRMAIPDAQFSACAASISSAANFPNSVKITLNDTDIKRAKQIASYPWFATKKPWQKEIERMLKNGFKLEVESLISKDISYVTETYVPERLKEEDWLD